MYEKGLLKFLLITKFEATCDFYDEVVHCPKIHHQSVVSVYLSQVFIMSAMTSVLQIEMETRF